MGSPGYAASAHSRTPRFAEEIQPFLQSYCFSCHGEGKSKGDVTLDSWDNEAAATSATDVWQRVLRKVQNSEMPPENRSQPSAAEKARLAAWIEQRVLRVDCDEPDPGRAPIRRLNRAEYNNTIRDLMGVDFKPAEDFPVDDSGHGFDNMADALSLSPVLAEKYLAAAERIVQSAFVLEVPRPGTNHYTVDAMEVGYNARQRGDGWVYLNSVEEDDVAVNFHSPVVGEYLVRVRAYGLQESSNAVQLTFMLGQQPVGVANLSTNAAAPEIYEARVSLGLGRNRIRAVVRRDKSGLREEEALRWKSGKLQKGAVMLEWLEIEGPVAIDPHLPDSHRRVFYTDSQIGTDREVARDVLGRFAKRAYRRPVTAQEVDRLVTLAWECWQRGDTFEQGVARAIQATLVSPHFLFRSRASVLETNAMDNRPRMTMKPLPYLKGGKKKSDAHTQKAKQPLPEIMEVDEFTLASRLSYFLWSSMPDDRLFALAEKNLLRANLESEVRRMLGHAKSGALVENFAGQWLQIRNLELAAPDHELFPKFNEALRRAMRIETEMLFANILQTDSTIVEFLTADYTYVNEALARHYGIPGVKGSQFQRVSLHGTKRRGVLTHGSVLTLTSNPTRTSPVKRGKWVLETLLNAPPPPPPPDVPELKEGKELSGTLRQRLEQHRADPLCASCHYRMDPIGFAMEHYDAIGAFREKDGKEPIDASGALASAEKIDGAFGLANMLAQSKREQFARAFTEKLMMYALGRGIEFTDKCALDAIMVSAAQEDYRFSSIVLQIVKSAPFQKMRVPAREEARQK